MVEKLGAMALQIHPTNCCQPSGMETSFNCSKQVVTFVAAVAVEFVKYLLSEGQNSNFI